MSSSGTLYSGTPPSSSGLYGAKQKFVWSATKSSEPGVSIINWSLYAVGKENASSNTKARTRCVAKVSDSGGGTIVGGSGKIICDYDSGPNSSTYVSYKGTRFASGTFQVKHSDEGVGGFEVALDVNIGGWDGAGRDASATFVLDSNVPYQYVNIDTGTGFVRAIPYIDNGTEFKVAEAYIDTGTEFKVCN